MCTVVNNQEVRSAKISLKIKFAYGCYCSTLNTTKHVSRVSAVTVLSGKPFKSFTVAGKKVN